MKAIHWIIAAAAFATVQPAQAGVNDPEVIIYRASGVLDSGAGDFNGTGTAIHCTNFSGFNEQVRFVIRDDIGTIVANQPLPISHLFTRTVLTKATRLYSGTVILNTGRIKQGTLAIAATSINLTCTAMQIEAAADTPQTAVLHMTRFNPIPNTHE